MKLNREGWVTIGSEGHAVRIAVAVVSIFLLFPVAAEACSDPVSTYFREVARSLTVTVQFEGKPLPSANVAISSFETSRDVASAATGRDGRVQFRTLRPGKYILTVEYMGIPSAREQIEVRSRTTAEAKSELDYLWGETQVPVRQIAGRLVEYRREGATPLEKTINPPVKYPVGGAQIQLQHPHNGSVFAVETNKQGEFTLAEVAPGVYVMNVRTGQSPMELEKFLVRVEPTVADELLHLAKGELCGSPIIFLEP